MLSASEIAELREFSEKMPYVSRIRKEFTDAAQQAERSLKEREANWSARETQPVHTHDPSAYSREQSLVQSPTSSDRTERDRFPRGR